MHSQISHLLHAYRLTGEAHVHGLPIYNNRLEVEAVGFEFWESRPLGVVITPWFMNLTLLPNNQDHWLGLELGSRRVWMLPSGPYEFLVSPVQGIGVVQALSLFTTVTDFPDQQTARDVALGVMCKVLSQNCAEESTEPISIKEVGNKMPAKTLSRRTLLRNLVRGID